MTVIICILAFLLLAYGGFTFFLFYIACWRFEMGPRFSRFLGGNGKEGPDWAAPSYTGLAKKGMALLDSLQPRALRIPSFDGLTLSAKLYENPNAQGVLVGCNGFRSTGVRDFAAAAPFYWQLGFSLLLADQRACGDSEGRCITYGVRERRDAQAWCREMEDRFPGLPILLAGVSLGGTTVLMASDELPPSVRAIVADCGFCSPYEQMEYVAYRTVPFEPGVRAVLFGVDMWCRLLAHFRLKEWSAQQALYKTDVPVCFIHGQADRLVPYRCTKVNRTACASPSVLLAVPDAGHAMAIAADPEGYYQTVTDFLDQYFF